MRETCIVGVGMTPLRSLPRPHRSPTSRRAPARDALADAGRRRGSSRRRSSSPTPPRARSKASTAFAARPRSTAAASATRRSSMSRTPAPPRRPRSTSPMCSSAPAPTIACWRSGRRRWSMPDPAKSHGRLRRQLGPVAARRRRSPTCWRWARGASVPPGAETEDPHSVFMDVYAAFCRHHMAQFGTTQRQMAAVSAKNHQHSVENPRVAISPRVHHRRGAGGAADRLAADAADVQPDQRRRGGGAGLLARGRRKARARRAARRASARACSCPAIIATRPDRRPRRAQGRRAAPTRPPGWGRRTSTSSNATTRPPSAKSCRARCSASSASAKAARRPSAATRGSAAASPSIPRAGLEFEGPSDRRHRTRPGFRDRLATARRSGPAAGRGRAHRPGRERRRPARRRGSRGRDHDPERAGAMNLALLLDCRRAQLPRPAGRLDRRPAALRLRRLWRARRAARRRLSGARARARRPRRAGDDQQSPTISRSFSRSGARASSPCRPTPSCTPREIAFIADELRRAAVPRDARSRRATCPRLDPATRLVVLGDDDWRALRARDPTGDRRAPRPTISPGSSTPAAPPAARRARC